jgi:hypothetical protein
LNEIIFEIFNLLPVIAKYYWYKDSNFNFLIKKNLDNKIVLTIKLPSGDDFSFDA